MFLFSTDYEKTVDTIRNLKGYRVADVDTITSNAGAFLTFRKKDREPVIVFFAYPAAPCKRRTGK